MVTPTWTSTTTVSTTPVPRRTPHPRGSDHRTAGHSTLRGRPTAVPSHATTCACDTPASAAPLTALPAHRDTWRFVTWNARALLHHHIPTARAKERRVRRLLNFFEALFVQETHGTDAAFRAALHRYRSPHIGWHTASADSSTGGVCILVANEVLATATVPRIVLILGRAHALLLEYRDGTSLALCNVHNEKLRRYQVSLIAHFVEQNHDKFSALGSLFMLDGDMNFHPPGTDGSTHITRSGEAHTRLNASEQRRWRPLFQRFSPIPPPTYTRIATAASTDFTTAVGSTIDSHPLLRRCSHTFTSLLTANALTPTRRPSATTHQW